MLNKKGRDPSVGGLIFVIAILIIVYTLILPPCDKCKLLNGNCASECQSEVQEKTLLDVSPGTIGELQDETIEHNLDTINLYIKDEPESKTLSNSLTIKNGFFGENDQQLNFKVDNAEDLEKVTLTFAVTKSRGNLIITLNGNQIFNQFVSSNNIERVILPVDFLEEDNTLRMQVTPPGVAFWLTNTYDLKDITLNQEYDLIRSTDAVTFSMSSSEVDSITDAQLDFYVFCKGTPGKANILKVSLNDNLVYNELIGCINDDFSVDLDEDDFESGVNNLEFTISDGEYLISDITVSADVSGRVYPSYVFYIDKQTYDDADRFYLDLDMDSNLKRATIIINDEEIDLDTEKSFVEYDITGKVQRGNNYIEIRPFSGEDFRVHELTIGYE